MAHLHWCYRFHITTIAMISGEGIWGAGCDVQEDKRNLYIHATAAIDLAKHVFQFHGLDARGRAVLSK